MGLFWGKKSSKDTDEKTGGDEQKGESSTLPIRGPPPPYSPTPPTVTTDAEPAQLTLHPSILPTPGVLVKLTPPVSPGNDFVQGGGHVGCDIVLCIDVSGSMGTEAPVPGDGNEDYGLSVLDLVKHAARTILESLNEGDRLGIVTFASQSNTVQNLIPMTEENKKKANKAIDELRPLDCTNLWHGIKDGLKLFEGETASGRVPAVMVLTDGLPNVMCPSQGYVPKLKTMFPLPAAIHTFGFGYSLRSGLLKSIAEIGGGNYAFIPDAGMIGTVFVHAVANLQSTFAASATLKLSYPSRLQLEETIGKSVEQEKPCEQEGTSELTIKLGNVQYGQTRDIWIKAAGATIKDEKILEMEDVITATISYTRVGLKPTPESLATSCTLADPTNLSPSELAYHQNRSALVAFLSSVFPFDVQKEHQVIDAMKIDDKVQELKELIPQFKKYNDALNESLLRDVELESGEAGQVAMALEQADFFRRWGKHYLPSLQNAHSRQICNTFKDPGPMQYCANSPLFVACRDRLDDAFDNLPPPKPSIHQRYVSTGASISMSSYNNACGVCFAANTNVRLATGAAKPIRALRRNDNVETLLGSRKVVAILKTRVNRAQMARIGDLLVTPWHPISSSGKTWEFPAAVPRRGRVLYTGSIYSVLLEPDDDPDAHAIRVNNFWGVTLGHGLLAARNDNRAHPFFGNYIKVVRAMQRLDVVGRSGVLECAGVRRSRTTGLAVGFKRVDRSRPVNTPGPEEAALELALLVEGKDIPEQETAPAQRRVVRRRPVRARAIERQIVEDQGEETDRTGDLVIEAEEDEGSTGAEAQKC